MFADLVEVTDPLLTSNPWFVLHASIALYSYAAFSVAFVGAALYLVLHREIKSKRLGTIFQRLPSLDQLDHVTYMSVTVGFVALTVSIITGMVWTLLRLGSLLQFDIKEIITIANWIVYAFYLHSRYYGRWRGRRAAWLAVCGFLVLLFNFLIVTVLSSTHAYI
jgi:ABC-type transport system involved in cytochrome c biogenesis permease subunit